MISAHQFSEYIIKPTLESMGKYSESAHVLLLGTALTESGLRYLKQLGDGPALGLYQMEPETHKDIWDNYLAFRKGWAHEVNLFMNKKQISVEQLIGNLAYATAMARVHYMRVPAALPDADDAEGMAHYHKVYYNTVEGKTNPRESEEHFKVAYQIATGK